jgi:hypothetical protein
MALSDFGRHILAAAPQHPLRLAAPPDRLPAAACQAVLNSLLKQGYVEECEAPQEYIGVGWRQDAAGAWIALRITNVGLLAIGADGAAAAAEPSTEIMPMMPRSESPAAAASGPVGHSGEATEAADTAATGQRAVSARPSLRTAAQALLTAWNANDGLGLAAAVDALRSAMPVRAMAPRPPGPRPPRQGTKQQQVLAMLRCSEGATVAQIMGATGWQSHTVRGFLAELKKRQGIGVEAAERVRQVGPGKTGAKGSFTVYRIAEAD